MIGVDMTDGLVDLGARRRALGLAQEKLAARAGVTTRLVSMVEKGYQPSPDYAEKILHALRDAERATAAATC